MDVLTKAMDEVAGQITKANVAMKTCQRYVFIISMKRVDCSVKFIVYLLF